MMSLILLPLLPALTRDMMAYDVLIVGAGPSGLSCAIRLKQLAVEKGLDISVCVLEKGAAVGAHLLSGAVLEPRALDELLPSWRTDSSVPTHVPVTSDAFYFMTEKKAYRMPTPPQMHNRGNFMISLGEFGAYLASQAESLGAEIYTGFRPQNC
jgi:electron-transferring-flavoprotein dehydrogenase